MGELLGLADVRGALTKRGVAVILGAVALLGATAGAVLFVRYSARAVPDPRRAAVAPFDVYAPGRERWRVDLASALSEALDRTGALAAVPQTVVAGQWRASATPAIAAVELARRTGARIAVFGRLDPAGGDSVVAQVAVVDAFAARPLLQLTVRSAATSPRHLADSLAAQIVGRLAPAP